MGTSVLPRAAALLAALIGASVLSTAQTRDPYVLSPDERPSATLPLAYGAVVEYSYPLTGIQDLGDELSIPAGYSISVFADTWQLGFESRPYGNLVRLGMRSVGRDLHSGWFLSYGHETVDWNYTDDRYRTVDTSSEASLYLIGYRFESGLKPGASFVVRMEGDFGYRTRGEGDYVIDLSLAAGGRVPIVNPEGSSPGLALTVLAYASPFIIGGNEFGQIALALGINATLGINLTAN